MTQSYHMVRARENMKFMLDYDLYDSLVFIQETIKVAIIDLLHDAICHRDIFWEKKLPEARKKILEKIGSEIKSDIFNGIVNGRANNTVLVREMIITSRSISSITKIFLEIPEEDYPLASNYTVNSREDMKELLNKNGDTNLREYLLTEALFTFTKKISPETNSLDRALTNTILLLLERIRLVLIKTANFNILMHADNFETSINSTEFAFSMTLEEIMGEENIELLPGEIVIPGKNGSKQRFCSLEHVLFGGDE